MQPISNNKKIKLKCRHNSDIRVILISPDHTIAQIRKRLSQDFGFEVTLKYEDGDGDLITLTSQSDLTALLHDHVECVNVIVYENMLPSLHSHRSHRAAGGAVTSLLRPIDVTSSDAPDTKEWSAKGNISSSLTPSAASSSVRSSLRSSDRFPLITNSDSNVTAQSIAERNIRWKRGEVLGQGAFGVVYLGLNVETGELMAVKLIECSTVTDREVASLENEISLLRNLKHPNIVRYLGMEVSSTSLAIFLEYIPGGSLKTVIDKFGRLEESVVRSYARQVLLGLEYLHRNGIAHRDVKGANCLVANDGVIKLADFGSSRHWRPSGVVGEGGEIVASDIKGTPSWMAPEVIRNQDTLISWKKADVWSLGCTTIEMSTGKSPWCQYSNPVTVLYHIACSDSLPEFPESPSVELISFLNACLQRDATRRPDITSLLLHPFVASASLNSWQVAGGSQARPSTVSTAPGGNGWEHRLSPVWKGDHEHSKSSVYFPAADRREHLMQSTSPVYELEYPPELAIPPQTDASLNNCATPKLQIRSFVNDGSSLTASDDDLAVASVEGGMADDECTLLSFEAATGINNIIDTRNQSAASIIANVHFPDPSSPRQSEECKNSCASSPLITKTPLTHRTPPFAYASEPTSQQPAEITMMSMDASFENDSLRDECEVLDADGHAQDGGAIEFTLNTAVSPDSDMLMSSAQQLRQPSTTRTSLLLTDSGVNEWSRDVHISAKPTNKWKSVDSSVSSPNKLTSIHQQPEFTGTLLGQSMRSSNASMRQVPTTAESPSSRRLVKTRQPPTHRSTSQLQHLSVGRPPTALLATLEISGDAIDPRSVSTRQSNVRTAASSHAVGSSIDLTDEVIDEDHTSVSLEHFESVLTSAPTQLNEHTAAITKIRMPPNRDVIISSSNDGTVKLWGLHDSCNEDSLVLTVPSRATLDGNAFPGVGAYDSSKSSQSKKGSGKSGAKVCSLWLESRTGGDVVWGGGSDGHIRLWSCDDARPLRLLKGHDDTILTMEGDDGISGCMVATGSADKSIRIWDSRSRKGQVMILKGHTDAVSCLLWTESGRGLVSGSKDKTIKQWDTRIGRMRQSLDKHFGAVTFLRQVVFADALIVGNSQRRIELPSFASSGREGMVNLWTAGGDCGASQVSHRGFVNYLSEVRVGASGHSVIASAGNETVKIWDCAKFRILSQLQCPNVSRMTWFGNLLVTGVGGGTMRAWKHVSRDDDGAADVNRRYTPIELTSHSSPCTELLSNNGVLVSGSKSGHMMKWS